MIKKLYPNGKAKAFNVKYDDGVLQDICYITQKDFRVNSFLFWF